jgi:ribosomal silencing factor RsfS|tara:strand:- start:1351 stop:1695 length:345 start_codon:yes stop_codon:yes gene_type:complete
MSTNIIDRFANNLTDIEYPKNNEGWNIKGIIKGHSNQTFKFDVRDMRKRVDDLFQKRINTGSRADKVVFETKTKWVILDSETLNKHVTESEKREFHIEDLMKHLDWNIYVDKSV